MNNRKIWDVIVIGAGPAGSSAAMVLTRMRRTVLIIDSGKPRNELSHGMHNYLTRDGELPLNYLKMAHAELEKYGVHHIRNLAVSAKKLDEHGFSLEDSTGEKHLCRRLLIATGVTDNIPAIPGMKEMWGNGVYHCPFCDGHELCDKNIGLYAKRYNGYGMALALRQLSASVTLFTDGTKYLKPEQAALLSARDITVISKPVAELSCSENRLTCVTFKDGTSTPSDAVFVHHGHKVNNDLLLQLGARVTRKGAAITNRKQECSVPGLYVAGDAAIDMHFVIVAAAEGAKAGVIIHEDLMAVDAI